jgi:hypothetical protein
MPPLVISGTAFLVFTAFLVCGRIGEASYCFLVAASALFGLALHGFPRLQELDLKKGHMVLRELKQMNEELFVLEEKLKAIALPLAQIIAFASASKGAEVYCEGRLTLRTWSGRDGAGLHLAAWEVQPMGQIGRRKPKVQSREEYARPRDERDMVPFDDPSHAIRSWRQR